MPHPKKQRKKGGGETVMKEEETAQKAYTKDQQHTPQSDAQLPDERNKDESKTASSKTESVDSYTFSKKNESASQSEKRGKKKKAKSEREKSQKDDSSSDEDHRKGPTKIMMARELFSAASETLKMAKHIRKLQSKIHRLQKKVKHSDSSSSSGNDSDLDLNSDDSSMSSDESNQSQHSKKKKRKRKRNKHKTSPTKKKKTNNKSNTNEGHSLDTAQPSSGQMPVTQEPAQKNSTEDEYVYICQYCGLSRPEHLKHELGQHIMNCSGRPGAPGVTQIGDTPLRQEVLTQVISSTNKPLQTNYIIKPDNCATPPHHNYLPPSQTPIDTHHAFLPSSSHHQVGMGISTQYNANQLLQGGGNNVNYPTASLPPHQGINVQPTYTLSRGPGLQVVSTQQQQQQLYTTHQTIVSNPVHIPLSDTPNTTYTTHLQTPSHSATPPNMQSTPQGYRHGNLQNNMEFPQQNAPEVSNPTPSQRTLKIPLSPTPQGVNALPASLVKSYNPGFNTVTASTSVTPEGFQQAPLNYKAAPMHQPTQVYYAQSFAPVYEPDLSIPEPIAMENITPQTTRVKAPLRLKSTSPKKRGSSNNIPQSPIRISVNTGSMETAAQKEADFLKGIQYTCTECGLVIARAARVQHNKVCRKVPICLYCAEEFGSVDELQLHKPGCKIKNWQNHPVRRLQHEVNVPDSEIIKQPKNKKSPGTAEKMTLKVTPWKSENPQQKSRSGHGKTVDSDSTPSTAADPDWRRKADSNKMVFFVCLKCDRQFPTSDELKAHQKDKEVCEEFLRLKSRQKGFKTATRFCYSCLKNFPTQNDYTRHRISCTNAKPETKMYSCFTCYKTFESQQDLSLHKQTQHRLTAAPSNCWACSQSFKNFKELLEHAKIHKDVRLKYPTKSRPNHIRDNHHLVLKKESSEEGMKGNSTISPQVLAMLEEWQNSTGDEAGEKQPPSFVAESEQNRYNITLDARGAIQVKTDQPVSEKNSSAYNSRYRSSDSDSDGTDKSATETATQSPELADKTYVRKKICYQKNEDVQSKRLKQGGVNQGAMGINKNELPDRNEGASTDNSLVVNTKSEVAEEALKMKRADTSKMQMGGSDSVENVSNISQDHHSEVSAEQIGSLIKQHGIGRPVQISTNDPDIQNVLQSLQHRKQVKLTGSQIGYVLKESELKSLTGGKYMQVKSAKFGDIQIIKVPQKDFEGKITGKGQHPLQGTMSGKDGSKKKCLVGEANKISSQRNSIKSRVKKEKEIVFDEKQRKLMGTSNDTFPGYNSNHKQNKTHNSEFPNFSSDKNLTSLKDIKLENKEKANNTSENISLKITRNESDTLTSTLDNDNIEHIEKTVVEETNYVDQSRELEFTGSNLNSPEEKASSNKNLKRNKAKEDKKQKRLRLDSSSSDDLPKFKTLVPGSVISTDEYLKLKVKEHFVADIASTARENFGKTRKGKVNVKKSESKQDRLRSSRSISSQGVNTAALLTGDDLLNVAFPVESGNVNAKKDDLIGNKRESVDGKTKTGRATRSAGAGKKQESLIGESDTTSTISGSSNTSSSHKKSASKTVSEEKVTMVKDKGKQGKSTSGKGKQVVKRTGASGRKSSKKVGSGKTGGGDVSGGTGLPALVPVGDNTVKCGACDTVLHDIRQVATHSCLVSKDNTRLGELGEVHMMSSSADQSQVGEQHGHVDIEGDESDSSDDQEWTVELIAD